MKAKKVWALVLAVSMAVGMLGGCGGKGGDGGSAADAAGSGSAAGEDGVVELTFYNADGQEDDPWSDPVAQALTEKTGVKLLMDHPVG